MPTTISVIQLGHTPIIGRKAIVKTGNGKWQQTATVTSYTKNDEQYKRLTPLVFFYEIWYHLFGKNADDCYFSEKKR